MVDTRYSIIDFFASVKPKTYLEIWTWNVGIQNDHFMHELAHELAQWSEVIILVGSLKGHAKAVGERLKHLSNTKVNYREASHRKIWDINKEHLYVGSKNLAADGCTDVMVEIPYTYKMALRLCERRCVKVVPLLRNTR